MERSDPMRKFGQKRSKLVYLSTSSSDEDQITNVNKKSHIIIPINTLIYVSNKQKPILAYKNDESGETEKHPQSSIDIKTSVTTTVTTSATTTTKTVTTTIVTTTVVTHTTYEFTSSTSVPTTSKRIVRSNLNL